MSRTTLRLASWNVNGMNAVMKKGFSASLRQLDADVVAVQETRLQEAKLTRTMRSVLDYRSYWAFSNRGRSGTAWVRSATMPRAGSWSWISTISCFSASTFPTGR